jgi:hypothetical protein
VRGAAPSIVCPRCEQEAPPQDALGKLATCRTCGLIFDAAPRDRQVPVRRRRTEPELEPAASEPEVKLPVGRRPLTPLQVVGVVVLILAVALLIEGPGPSERRGPEEPREPWFQTFVERHRIAAWFAAYGTDSCVALGEALRRPPMCVEPASELRVLEALDYVVKQPGFRAGMCRITLAETDAMLLKLRCVRR